MSNHASTYLERINTYASTYSERIFGAYAECLYDRFTALSRIIYFLMATTNLNNHEPQQPRMHLQFIAANIYIYIYTYVCI